MENVLNKVDLKSNNRPIKVLIVEDDETWASYLRVLFRKVNCEILNAVNGKEAITICKQHSDIDLILMDINMPELNGCEATRQIRKFNKEVIIIAQSSDPDEEKAINAGFNSFISKVLLKNQLPVLISKYCNSKMKL
ncbi:MAG: hypothetical protein A2W99_07430 [Bacteroidetes bacterium GWF2_33_16]|nr:MAG: hypothetical protein A2X00_10380 [Bacteroidetes bacterium GWE2_32_14]OFY03039.1 MAG: hypothetical protein A2W99_07430 [Bacteroidetes bacterium GWF2_33_16]